MLHTLYLNLDGGDELMATYSTDSRRRSELLKDLEGAMFQLVPHAVAARVIAATGTLVVTGRHQRHQ
jgi:hypothetical protein